MGAERNREEELKNFLSMVNGVKTNAKRIVRGVCPDFEPTDGRVVSISNFNDLTNTSSIFCRQCKGGRGIVFIFSGIGKDRQPEVKLPSRYCNTAPIK